MTREEVEKKIYEKTKEILVIVAEYAPNTDYFTLSYCNGAVVFWNDYWNLDESSKIDFFKKEVE